MKLLEERIRTKEKWLAGANESTKNPLTEWSFSFVNDPLFEVGLWRGKNLSTKYFSEMKMRTTHFKTPYIGIKLCSSRQSEDEVGHCI